MPVSAPVSRVQRLVEAINFPSTATSAQQAKAFSGPRVTEIWEVTSIVLSFQNWSGVGNFYSGAIVRGGNDEVIATFSDPEATAVAVDRFVTVNLQQPLELYPGESLGFIYGAAVGVPQATRIELRGQRLIVGRPHVVR